MGVEIIHHPQESLHVSFVGRAFPIQHAVNLLSRKMDPLVVDRVAVSIRVTVHVAVRTRVIVHVAVIILEIVPLPVIVGTTVRTVVVRPDVVAARPLIPKRSLGAMK